MKRLLIFFLAFTSATICLVAQPKFAKGYIITNSTDTIYGLIDNSNLNQNFLKCVFIKEPNSEQVTYKPGEIKAYRIINNKYYISASTDPDNPANVFLEYLINGLVDLFYYFDENTGPHYYINKEGLGFKELKNEKKIREIGDKKYEYQTREYIGILKNYFIDDPEIFPRVESSELRHNSLIDIAADYHNKICPGEECIIYAKRKIKPEFSFGLMADGYYSFLSYKYVSGFFSRVHLPDFGYGYAIGGFVDIKDPFFSNRISLRLEPMFARSAYNTDSTSLNLNLLNLPLTFRYSFPGEKTQATIFAGMGYTSILNFDYGSRYGSAALRTGKSFINAITGAETSFNLKNKNRIFFQLKYEYALGYNIHLFWQDGGNVIFNLVNHNIHLTGGYRF